MRRQFIFFLIESSQHEPEIDLSRDYFRNDFKAEENPITSAKLRDKALATFLRF